MIAGGDDDGVATAIVFDVEALRLGDSVRIGTHDSVSDDWQV